MVAVSSDRRIRPSDTIIQICAMMKAYLIAVHVLLVTQAFEMSVFNRLELKVCRKDTLVLGCSEDQVLWVHEAFAGANPLYAVPSSGDVHICVAEDEDCRQEVAHNDTLFRATSIRPHYVEMVTHKIYCLSKLVRPPVTYKLVYYSCIQKQLLDPIPMLSSVTRVTNTAHVQLAPLPGDEGVNGRDVSCSIHSSTGPMLGMTLTMVYIDLPHTSPCSQRFWVNDQASKLVSLCSPVWLRQQTVYQSIADKVELHFKSTLASSSTAQQSGDDAHPQPSLFLWLYIHVEESFTVTCGQHGAVSSVGPSFPVTPVTDPSRSVSTSSPPPEPHSPTSTSSPPPEPPTTSSPPPDPPDPASTHATAEDANSTLGTPPPPRHTSSPSTGPPPAANPTYHSTTYHLEPTQEVPPTTTSHSIPAKVTYSSVPKSIVDAAAPVSNKWKTAAISMGVVVVVVILVGVGGWVRHSRIVRRRALLQQEQEMPYEPNMWSLAAATRTRPGIEDSQPDQDVSQSGAHECLGMASSAETLTSSNEPIYYSIHV